MQKREETWRKKYEKVHRKKQKGFLIKFNFLIFVGIRTSKKISRFIL
jgi:hypothetical protein